MLESLNILTQTQPKTDPLGGPFWPTRYHDFEILRLQPLPLIVFSQCHHPLYPLDPCTPMYPLDLIIHIICIHGIQ